jgi:hypothetical protein
MQVTTCPAQGSMNTEIQKALFSPHWREMKSPLFVVFKRYVIGSAMWAAEA